MRRTLTKTLRSCLAVLLVLCMVISLVPATVFATEPEDDTPDGHIDYVSLGASNTNGYGIRGYLPAAVTEDPLAASKADMNVYGYTMAPAAAYPAQIADALGADLHQLAISSMRTDEVLYLLGEEYSYVEDDYMKWRFTGGEKWFEIAEPGGVDALRAAYKEYLTEAEIITIDLGWNNFGVYAFNNIKTILADGNYWKKPDFNATSKVISEEDYKEIKKQVEMKLAENMDFENPALKEKMGLMLDVLTYATLGAIGHFDSIVEQIYAWNPDAQIVVINIQNLADDLVVEFEGQELKLGDLYGELIDLVNLYRASQSPYADRYAFADAGDVETFLDEMVAWNGDPTTLGENMVDCFDMYDDDLYVRSIVEYMMVGQALSGLFDGFRTLAAGYDLEVFKNDSRYTYEFALTRTPEELLALNLGALDFNNPGGADEDVERYGAAVAKHLKNLRGDAANAAAYDYIFDDLLAEVEGEKQNVVNGLTTIFNGINQAVAGMGVTFNVDGYYKVLTDNSDAVVNKETRADFVEKFYADYKAEGDAKLAKFKEYLANEQIVTVALGNADVIDGLYRAAEGYVQITEGIAIINVAKAEFAAKLEGVYNTYHNTLNYAYDVVATFVQYVARINSLEVNADSLNGFNSAADSLMDIVFNDFLDGAQRKFYYELEKNGVQTTGASEVPEYELGESVFENNPALCAVAVLAVRYELGNSFFAHPNETGHDQITYAVLKALTESDSGEFTEKKLELYMSLLKEKYPNLYAMLMGEHNLEDVDDLTIIVEMLKMTDIGAAYGVDLDALEAQIRAELRAYEAASTPEEAAKAEAACYRIYKKLMALAAASTATDYVPTEDSYYVSLGDSTITGYGLEGYEDGVKNGWLQTVSGAAHTLLAKELYGENWKNQFLNYCQGSLRADDLLLFLGGDVVMDDYYYAEIEPNLDGTLEETQQAFIKEVQNADLISVAIGGGNFLTFAGKYMNRVMYPDIYGPAYKLDWERIGVDSTDESMQELQEALDLLVPIIDALGLLDQYLPEGVEIENPAKFARALAEGLLYGYASYNYYYTQVLERIKEINPDAHLLILGMFNPVDDWTMTTTIDGEEVTVNIGGTVANLMELANLQNLAFALENENTSYVDISDAETILEAEKPGVVLGFDDYYNSSFQSNGKAVHASVAGHEYIAKQMYEALSTEYSKDEVIALMEEVLYLITEYYDEAYAYAYRYARDEGYIEEAKAAIDEVIAALNALDLSGVQMTDEFRAELEIQIAKTIETLEAAKALLLEADELDQATLDALVALLNEAGDSLAHILHLLEQAGIDVNQLVIIPALKAAHDKLLNEVIPAIVEDLQEAVKAGTEYLLEKLGEAYDALVEALAEHIAEKAPEAADWIYNWLYNNPDKVIAFFNEYGDDMVAFLEEYGDEIALVLGYLLVNYGDEVLGYVLANGDEILVVIVKWYEVHGDNAWALVKVYLDALGITDCVNGTVGEIIGTLTAEVERAKAELEASINELKAMLESLEAQLENASGEVKAEIEAAIAQIKAAIAELEAMLAELNAALDNLAAALEQLEKAIAKLIAEGFDAAAEEVQAALDAVAAAAKDLVALVSEEAAAQIEKLLEQLKTALNDRYQMATHGTYTITPDSYYVALGDGTAAGDSYVDLLADALEELRGYKYGYNNLAQDNLLIQDTYEVILENAGEIAKADLVTLGYGNNGMNNFAITHLMNLLTGRPAELDWVTYVGEEGMAYVEDMKADLYEELIASGVSGQYQGMDITDLLVSAVEAYAYSCVAYSSNLPEVVNTVHAINPDAQVVIVGMYNPLADVVLEINGNELAIGEYLQKVVDAANISALAFAMVTGDAVYVDAPAVEVKNTNTSMTIAQFISEFMYYKAANLQPTAAGHAYINQQILNALTITVEGLLGDADNNGVVNAIDAMYVLHYYTGANDGSALQLGVCDVDGNGVVNALDAMYILQFYTGAIAKFPIEN